MKNLFFLSLIIIFIAVNNTAIAQNKNHVKAELISEVEYLQPGVPFWVAIKLEMQKDWHTYWRNPGDAGLATTIKWDLPEGFNHSEIYWPYPHLFIVEEIANYGYENKELLLVKIIPPKELNKTVTFKAKVNWLACRIECVPESEEVSLDLAVKNETPKKNERWQNDFEKAKSKLPYQTKAWKFSSELKKESVIINVTGKGLNEKELTNIRFFPYASGIFNNVAEQKIDRTEQGFKLEIKLDDFKIKDPENIYGLLYSETGWDKNKAKAIEIKTNFSN